MRRLSLNQLLVVLVLLAALWGVSGLAAEEGDGVAYLPAVVSKFGEAPLPANRVEVLGYFPIDPADMAPFDRVTVNFNYYADKPDGVRIWAQPYTNGEFTAFGGYEGSSVLPPGVHSGERWFFVTQGTVTVDQIRIVMKTADNSELLYEEFIDVEYNYSD